MLQRAFYAFDVFQGGEAFKIGIGDVVIFQGIRGIRHVVEALLPFGCEQQHAFAPAKMAVENVRQIQIIMQKGF